MAINVNEINAALEAIEVNKGISRDSVIEALKESMEKAKEALEMHIEPDLVELDIQNAHNCLKEILGEVHREDLLDALFSSFCLGK